MASRKTKLKKTGSTRRKTARKRSQKAMARPPAKPAGLKDFADNIGLLENKHYGVILFDAETLKILFANTYLRNKIGYTKKELIGRNLLELVLPEDCDRIINTIKARVKGGPVETGNRYTALRKSGSTFPIEVFSNPVIHNGIICVQSIIKDITDVVELENNLRASESRFKSFFQLSPEAVLTFDRQGRVTSVNRAAERLTGYKGSKLIGGLYHRLPFWHDNGKVKRLKLDDITGKKPFQRFIKSSHDGIKFVEIFTSRIPLEKGEYEILLIARDITARKQYEDKLLSSERKHKALINNILDGIAVVYEGRYIYVDKKFTRIFGYSIDELMGRSFTKIVTGKWKKILAELEIQIWRGKSSYRQLDIKARKRNGSSLDIDLRASRIEFEDKRALQITVTDISRRKNAEKLLSESEEKLKAIFRSIEDSVFVIDKKGRFVHFEKPGKSGLFYGQTARILGRDIRTVLPEHMARSFRKALREITATMRSFQKTYSFKIGGKTRWFSTRFSPIRDDQGDFAGVTVVARDVTDQVQAHDELRHERDLTRSILETANSLIVCLDYRGRITVFNRECELVTGFKREEVIGHDWADLFLPKSHYHKGLKDFVAWVRKHPYDRYEGPLVTKAGEIRIILWSNSSIIGRTKEDFVAIAIGHDITDRKKAEEALRDSEEKYRTLVENAGEAITVIDREGHFIVMNSIAAKRLGGKPEDYIGKTLWDAFPQMIAERHITAVVDVIDSGRGTIHENPTVLQGEQYWYHTRIQPLPDHEGRIKYALIIARDITARRQADEEIRKFKTIADEAAYGTAIVDLEGYIVYINEYFADRHGYKAKDLIGKNLSIFHNDEQIPEVNRLYTKLIREGSCTSVEVWHMHKDGSVFPTLMSASIIKDDTGCPIYLSATALDITERKKAEEALRESQRRQRAILSNIPDMAWLKDKESRFIAVNEQFGKECGVSPEELVGQTDLDVWPRELADRYRADDREVMELGQRKRVEEPLADKDGVIKMIETIKTPIYNDKGEIIGTTGIAHDITERKQAEEALRMSEERLSSIFDGSRDAVFITGADSMFHDVNRAAVQLTGYSKEELLSMSIPDLHDTEDLQAYRLFFKRIMNGESITSEANIRRKDGRKIPTEFSNRRIFIGNTPFMHTAARDITERKQAEEALKKERDRLNLVFENLPVLAVAFDENLNIIACNKSCQRVSGYDKSEIIGNPRALSILCPQKKYRQWIIDMLQGSTEENDSWEWQIRSKNGEDRIIAWTNVSNKISVPGFAIWGVGLDITEAKKAEIALKNQRDMLRDVTEDVIKVQEDERRRISMELHDSIGQSLSVIKLQIQNIIKSADNGDFDINRGLETISKLVLDSISDLRQISANLRPVILDNLGLWPTIEWYLRDFGKKTDLAIKVNTGGMEVSLPPRVEVHIFRIIQEIMINIQKHSEAKNVSFESRIEDSKLVFEIREDGQGFDTELMYEPSERRRGMGLINIMERVNIVKGYLDIQSAPQQGARFVVSVPIEKK